MSSQGWVIIDGVLQYGGTISTGGQILAAAGSATTPSLSFSGDPDTGLFNEASNRISFGGGGGRLGFWSSSALTVETLLTATSVGVGVSPSYPFDATGTTFDRMGNFTQNRAAGTNYGIVVNTQGAGTNGYGVYASSNGATSSTNYGIYTTASAGAINYSLYGAAGILHNVGRIESGNLTTVGTFGVPNIVAASRSTAQTAAVASVATFTVGASDGTFEIGANVNVTTSNAENFNVQATYTDETNTSRTLNIPLVLLAGTVAAAVNFANGASPYEGVVTTIRCKAATAITIKTTGTFTGATYNVEGIIKQLA